MTYAAMFGWILQKIRLSPGRSKVTWRTMRPGNAQVESFAVLKREDVVEHAIVIWKIDDGADVDREHVRRKLQTSLIENGAPLTYRRSTGGSGEPDDGARYASRANSRHAVHISPFRRQRRRRIGPRGRRYDRNGTQRDTDTHRCSFAMCRSCTWNPVGCRCSVG